MQKILLSFCYGFLLIFLLVAAAFASDITVNGSAYFKCKFTSSYMAKHGYSLIQENLYIKDLKTNLYAAKDAEVIIKNRSGIVVGYGTADEKGNYSISVPEGERYLIIMKFHGQEIEKAVSSSDAKDIITDLGYFSTEIVGRWIDAKLRVW